MHQGGQEGVLGKGKMKFVFFKANTNIFFFTRSVVQMQKTCRTNHIGINMT